MTEKLVILQNMEKLTNNIKAMEEKMDIIRSLDANLVDSVQIHYVIPINYKYPYGKAETISKEENVQFSIPEGLKETVIDSIKHLYEQCLERHYQLLDEYAVKLKKAP